MRSLNSNSIFVSDCKQGTKSEMEICLLQRKPKNNGVCAQRLYRCLPEVRRRMQLMGSEIGFTVFGQPVFSIKPQLNIKIEILLQFDFSFFFMRKQIILFKTGQCLCALPAGLLQAHTSLHAHPEAGASWLFPRTDGPLYLPGRPAERGIASAGLLSTTPRVQLGPG